MSSMIWFVKGLCKDYRPTTGFTARTFFYKQSIEAYDLLTSSYLGS